MSAQASILEAPAESHQEGHPRVISEFILNYDHRHTDNDSANVCENCPFRIDSVDNLSRDEAAQHFAYSESHHGQHCLLIDLLLLLLALWSEKGLN